MNKGEVELLGILDEHDEIKAIALLTEKPSYFYRMNPAIIKKALDEKYYELIQHVIINACSAPEHQTLCDVSNSTNALGQTYIQQLNDARPAINYPSTGKIYFLLMMQSLQARPKDASHSQVIYESFMVLNQVFDEPGLPFNQNAFIGLMLINRKHMDQLDTPFYTRSLEILQALGVHSLSKEQEIVYWQVLESIIAKKPDLFIHAHWFREKDDNILDLLSKHYLLADKTLRFCQFINEIQRCTPPARGEGLECYFLHQSRVLQSWLSHFVMGCPFFFVLTLWA